MTPHEEAHPDRMGLLTLGTITLLGATLVGGLIGGLLWSTGHGGPSQGLRSAREAQDRATRQATATGADGSAASPAEPKQTSEKPSERAQASLSHRSDRAANGSADPRDAGGRSTARTPASGRARSEDKAATPPGVAGGPSATPGASRSSRPATGGAPPNASAAEGSRPPLRTATPSPPPPIAPPVNPAPPPPEPPQEQSPTDETPPADGDGASDRSAPVLESLHFDPPEVADGAVTALLVQVSDDLSGVKSVSGNVRSPSGVAILPFEARAETTNNVFVTRLTIPGKAETGVWHIGNLFVVDRANNSLVNSFTEATVPPGGTLRVSSAESDSKAPTVRSASVEKRSLGGGEKNVIRVEADDDRSGVSDVTGAFQSPSKSALIRFLCRHNGDSTLWEGEVPVPANADCGEWTLQHLRVADKAGNFAFFPADSPQVVGVGFLITGQNCDATAPTLEAFDMSPTSVSNQAQSDIVVTATIRDEGSGAISGTGWAEGPLSTNGQTPRIYFSLSRNPNDLEGPWTGKIVVPQYAAKGNWKVALVRLQDRALNTRDYKPEDAVLAGAVFRVD